MRARRRAHVARMVLFDTDSCTGRTLDQRECTAWLGEIVGFVTSGGYAHWSQKSVAIGFMPVEMIVEGAEVEIEILGEKRTARVITAALYDADACLLRG